MTYYLRFGNSLFISSNGNLTQQLFMTDFGPIEKRHFLANTINNCRRIAMEQRAEMERRDSESSLTDSSVRQPHWTNAKPVPAPNSRPSSRSASRQNSRPGSRHQLPIIPNPISTQRQQDLNK